MTCLTGGATCGQARAAVAPGRPVVAGAGRCPGGRPRTARQGQGTGSRGARPRTGQGTGQGPAVQIRVPGPAVGKPSPGLAFDALVLSGGGARGTVLLGAVHHLRRAGALDRVRTVVGTSVGAVVGAAVALGLPTRHVLGVFMRHAYKPALDPSLLLTRFGLDRGTSVDALVEELLQGRRYALGEVPGVAGRSLVVCATNVDARRPVYFAPDTHPDMDLALALRMSCSLPLWFAAVRHEGALYADGGLTDNFPCAWAARTGHRRVLGLAFRAVEAPVSTLDGFVQALLECAAVAATHPAPTPAASEDPLGPPGPPGPAHQPAQPAQPAVLLLDHEGARTFDLGMSRDRKRELFESGARQAAGFLKKTV